MASERAVGAGQKNQRARRSAPTHVAFPHGACFQHGKSGLHQEHQHRRVVDGLSNNDGGRHGGAYLGRSAQGLSKMSFFVIPPHLSTRQRLPSFPAHRFPPCKAPPAAARVQLVASRSEKEEDERKSRENQSIALLNLTNATRKVFSSLLLVGLLGPSVITSNRSGTSWYRKGGTLEVWKTITVYTLYL